MRSLSERFPRLERCAGYFHPGEPRPIGRRGWVAFSLLLLVAALPSLWAPFDGDQALFFVSGQKILRGEVVYRDIVDLKPPLIYFIYAGAIGVFGKSVAAVRIVEILVQFGVVAVITRTVRRASGNDAWGMLSGTIQAALYFSLPFYCRGQVEGFAALPIALIASILISRHVSGRDRGVWIMGLLLGILLLLKTSFLVMLPLTAAFILFDRDSNRKRRLRGAIRITLGFVLPIAVFFLYLWANDALYDAVLMWQFTKGYGSAQWGSLSALVTETVRGIPWYFMTTYSALFAFLTVVGIFFTLFPMRSAPAPGVDGTNSSGTGGGVQLLLRFSLVTFLVLLATVAVEAKYLAWHFNRLFAAGAILGGWGAVIVVRHILAAPMSRFSLCFGVLCLLPLFLFSPLPRYAKNNSAFAAHGLKGTEGFVQSMDMEDSGFNPEELRKVGDYIRGRRKTGEKLFAASGWGGSIHYYAGDIPDFKIFHSCYLIAPYAPETWRRETVRYLLTEHPQFIVAQRDAMPHISGNETTSLEMLHALPGIDSLLRTSYRAAMETRMTVVYERR